MIRRSALATLARDLACSAGGNMSISRSIVLAALGVFIVAMHEVARLARGDGHAHRLGVAQLADDDDVGVLAQRRLERGPQRARVRADLALADERALARVDELDRVLDA